MTSKSTSRKRKTKAKTSDPFKKGFWVRHAKEALILFALAVGLYAMSIPYEFVLDDQIVVTDNAFTKKGINGIGDIFGNDSFTGYFGEQKDLVAGARYRPLSIAMFAVIYEVTELDPRAYHLVNILLYGLLSLLVFRVVSLFFTSKPRIHWLVGVPFVCALLFTIHPVHTEAVANVKGADEILAMMASLLALYAVLRFAIKGSIPWLISSAVLFFIGLMAKENTITFLAVIPAALYFFTKTNLKKGAIAMLPIILATAAYLIVRIDVIGFLFSENTSNDLLNNPFVEMTMSEKYATITYTLGLYLKLLFFPHPLTHDYYPYHIEIMNWLKPGVIASVGVFLLMITAAIAGLKKKWVLSFCVIFFFATISIISNIFFPVGTFMNERFIFMPSLAFCIGFAYYLDQAHLKFSWAKWLAPAILGIYIIGFVYKTVERIPVWENAMSLNTAGVAVSQNSARANCFMGTALYKSGQDISDRTERLANMELAESYIDKSLSIHPSYLSANQMKSGVLAEHYRYDSDISKLLSGFEHILEVKPNVAYIPRYCEYLNGRNRNQSELLAFYYRVSYEIMALRHRRFDYAQKFVNYGLSVDPNDAQINFAAGQIQKTLGNAEQAATYLNKAYSIDPSLRNR